MVDYNTPLGQVRLLIPDTAMVTQARNPDTGAPDYEPAYIFSDEQIEAFIALENGNIKRAAATAIGVVATDEALLSKVIKTEDLQTDGSKVSAALLNRARLLRAEADDEDRDRINGDLEVVPMINCSYAGQYLDGTVHGWPLNGN